MQRNVGIAGNFLEAFSLVAVMPLAAAVVEELSALFGLFDLNGDGEITAKELEQVLNAFAGIVADEEAAGLRELMPPSGALSRSTFLQWAQRQSGFEVHQILRDLFLLIDGDGSGELSLEEFSEMFGLLQAADQQAAVSAEALFAHLDSDRDGRIRCEEFLALIGQAGGLALSLAELKRLKKTLVHRNSTARLPAVGLVEVDCDLGAGTAGAGCGIALLKDAVQRQQALRRISERLLQEIDAQQRPRARASELGSETTTPHARHIDTIAHVMADAADLVAAMLRQRRFPVVLAGDHSTAAATIAGIRRAHPRERLGVIWIDAHADIHSPFTTPSGNMHGMPLAIAAAHDNLAQAINAPDVHTRQLWRQLQGLSGLDDPCLDLKDLVYIAVRDTEPAEDATLLAHRIPVISTEWVRQQGGEAAACSALAHLAEVDRIYVSFDVDALDSTICKGTGTPVPGGLWAEEALAILRRLLADPRVCCWEICEINPHLDDLNTLAEVSLGIFQGGLEVLSDRFNVAGACNDN